MTPQDIANILLDLKAVTLNVQEPFTYTSGMRGPIYCDNRMMISHPTERTRVTDAFVEVIKKDGLKFDVLGGTSTAGIPYAAFLAERLGVPMVYIRGKAKGHGKKKQVEGDLKPGQRVLIVEDLVTTGGSSIDSVTGVRNEGGEVSDVLAIFSYQLPKAVDSYTQAGVTLHALSTFNELIPVAVERGDITQEEAEKALAWNKDPDAWATKMELE